MSKVSVSKSLMVIRAIEKYGAFSKKKKKMKRRLRHKLHLGPSNEEEKQAQDEKRNKQIEQDAKDDPTPHEDPNKRNRQGPTDPSKPVSDGHNGDEDGSGDEQEEEITPDMHDGMKKEDMSDQQRAERATALIRSAFSKGLKGEKKEILNDAQAEDTKIDDAHQDSSVKSEEQNGK